MDCCLYSTKPAVVVCLSSTPSSRGLFSFDSARKHRIPSLVNLSGSRPFGGVGDRSRTIAVASAAASDREFSSLNTPYEPKSPAGRFLSTVLQNDIRDFHTAVTIRLAGLADDRRQAADRMNLSFGSDEECLHRKIAELQENECQVAVQDIIYMLIFYKFREMRVHLVPRLSSCICNGRLEIWPSKDWELESIHSFEVLEMVREHLTAVVGWKADATVTDNWATKEINRLQLCRIYVASILYGYFLKSASLRHNLELSLAEANHDLGISYGNCQPQAELWSYGLKSAELDRISSIRSTSVGQESCSRAMKHEKLRGYVMRFDPETLQMHAKPKTKEAVSLIEKHSCALFGHERTGMLEIDRVISTSVSSLKRLALEAVAFGSFLWDAEEYVNAIYKLNEN